jgi:hypothetical protein
MKAKIAIIGVFLAAIAAIVLLGRKPKPEGGGDIAGDSASASSSAAASSGAAQVAISMLYSSEKKEWVDAAAAEFAKVHPEIQLTLTPKGSLALAQAVVDDKEKPTIVSPADSLVLNLAAADWKTKGRPDLFDAAGEDAPESLVVTPLVFVIWRDRAEALMKSTGPKKADKGDAATSITWKTIHKAVTSTQGWPAFGGRPEWGFVKLGHTDPTQSNSGLQALYLMTLEFYGKPTLEVGDLLKPDYQQFMKETEKGVTRFEASTGTFMTDMIRFGPSRYDMAIVYESLAISQIANAEGRWGELRVYYPQTTAWSDHPAVVLRADWVTDAQRKAARTWLQFLRSRPIQERALAYGFRPGDPSVPVKSEDAANPWTRLAMYGVQVDIPAAARVPDGPVVRNLLTLWSRTVDPNGR